MINLLAEFSVAQILIFITLLLFAIKGIWDLIDYFKGKYKEKFNKDYNKLNKEEADERRYQEVKEQHKETLQIYANLDNKLDKIADSVASLTETVDGLVTSDKLDIKQFIVREYHYFVEQKRWIDDYSFDCIMLRYEMYKKEGGNSYIDSLINEIKALPKHPPIEN